MVSRAFSAPCVYSKFGHHPHPVKDTFVPNFVSLAAFIAELTHGEKSHTQSKSLTLPAYLMPREPKRLRFGTILTSLCEGRSPSCMFIVCDRGSLFFACVKINSVKIQPWMFVIVQMDIAMSSIQDARHGGSWSCRTCSEVDTNFWLST